MSTIVAPATPKGESAIAVVRISGDDALRVLNAIFTPRSTASWAPKGMRYGTLHRPGNKADVLDMAMAAYFPAPSTYTGENMAELHLHGNPLTVEDAVEACITAGAQPAQPGEFTLRAFANGKIDLSQAEAVMDLLSAATRRERAAALRRHNGEATKAVTGLQDALTDLLAETEAELNYPEDDIPSLPPQQLHARIDALLHQLMTARDSAMAAERLKRGARVSFAGKANAGKSSLFNALAGIDRVMVSDVPGTTRDVVEHEMLIDGCRVILCDTAGLREGDDALEREAQRRARDAIAAADLIIAVCDGAEAAPALDLPADKPVLRVTNKMDLLSPTHRTAATWGGMLVSALTGEGLDALRAAIARHLVPDEENAWLSGARAIAEADRAMEALQSAKVAVFSLPLDIVAEELREAWRALGAITGQQADEAIIDRVFERFCLGK